MNGLRDWVVGLLVWTVALYAAGLLVVLYAPVPGEFTVGLAVALMALGGALALLAAGFVRYYRAGRLL